jgi:hypothetical protein
MVRTTLGAEVDTTVSVSGSESVEFINADLSDTIPAGGQTFIDIRPPDGSIYVLLAMLLDIDDPNGSSTGDHEVRFQSEKAVVELIFAQSDHTERLKYDDKTITFGNLTKLPTGEAAQALATQGPRADDTNGFQLDYRNNTDVDQTSGITFRLWVRKVQVSG